MIAPPLKLRVSWLEDGKRQPRADPRLMAVLVVILALVNVSAAVVMVETWASMSSGMHELEGSMQDRLTDILN